MKKLRYMQSTVSCEEDYAELRRMAQEFAEGFNLREVDRLMRFYGESYTDVNLRESVQSHEQRRAYLVDVMRRGDLRIQVHPDEIVVRGEIAFVRGRINLESKDSTGAGPSTTELRYLEVACKGPDGWKAVWGMDGPVQEYSDRAG